MPQDRNDGTSTLDKKLASTAERATEAESGAWTTRPVTTRRHQHGGGGQPAVSVNYVPLFAAAIGAALGPHRASARELDGAGSAAPDG